ncbi:MAG: PAS domain S-box protein [Proteobacteria bacterium]|jgi:PAS domain S-box-containing protein|nr:PAS domain S-box protein [Pseudomonadota bacterium]HOL36398.1 PAS domain S-box protein [Rubrivivax sp.]
MTLRRFLFLLIWWCVLPLFGLAAALAAWHVAGLRAQNEQAAQRLSANAAAVLDRYVEARVDALQMLALSPLADDPPQLAGLYREAQAFRRLFGSEVALVRPDRTVVFSTAEPLAAPLPPAPRPAGRSAIDEAVRTGAPAVGDLVADPASGELRVGIAVPAMRSGQTAFVLVSLAAPEHFGRYLAQITLPKRAALELRDSRSQLIARIGAGDITDALTRTVALGQAPWSVALVRPRSEAVAPVAGAAAALALAVLVATLAGVLGGIWAGRRLAGAVASLADGSGRHRSPVDITEVEAARAMLHRSDQARTEAEQQRRDSDARHRAELERASLALQTREAMLRGVVDSASEAIVTADAAQVIVMANPAAAQMFRCPAPQLVGRPLASLLPERYRHGHADLVRRFGSGDDRTRRMRPGRDVLALRADGEEFIAEVGISHVHVDGCELYTAIVRDITERRRAEAEVLASKRKLETALASMNDAVMITDAQGRIVEFNDACVRFHRFGDREACRSALDEQADLIEASYADGTPVPAAAGVVQRALAGETVSQAEFRLRRKDSGAHWIASYSYAPIRDAEGAITGAVITAHDISELKQSQADLEASNRALQRLLAAQDRVQEGERQRIARELHDDLQQTLAAITMEVATARRDAQASAEAAVTLARIQALATAGIVSTRRIVNDLRPRILEDLGLGPALEALAAAFAQRNGLACEFQTDLSDSDEAAQAPAIATCLYRVAQEALNNIGKHAGARHVRIALVRLAPRTGEAAGGARLRLTIADDGHGHSPADLVKPGSFGLLGMSERVRAFGGSLRVDSPPEGGTTVEVEVPLPASAT